MKQVSKYDAANLERDLKRELFGTWSEKWEVMTASKIPLKDFHGYLGYLENAYEGNVNTSYRQLQSTLYKQDVVFYVQI